jgi:hypothetical protein
MMRGLFRRKLKDFAELQKENQQTIPILDRFKMPNFEAENQDDMLAKRELKERLK